VENIKPMENFKPMTGSQCETFLHLTIAEQSDKKQFDKIYHDELQPRDMICKIIEKRIEAFKLPHLEPSAIVFISLLSEGNPGRSILGLIETLEHAMKSNPELIDSTFIAMEVYPWGFHTPESFEKEFEARRDHPKGRWDFIIDGAQEIEENGKTVIKAYTPSV
jgi:hypothetical protein